MAWNDHDFALMGPPLKLIVAGLITISAIAVGYAIISQPESRHSETSYCEELPIFAHVMQTGDISVFSFVRVVGDFPLERLSYALSGEGVPTMNGTMDRLSSEPPPGVEFSSNSSIRLEGGARLRAPASFVYLDIRDTDNKNLGGSGQCV